MANANNFSENLFEAIGIDGLGDSLFGRHQRRFLTPILITASLIPFTAMLAILFSIPTTAPWARDWCGKSE
jgi:hypothetical protein